MSLTSFFSICFIVAFLYMLKTAFERKKEREDSYRNSKAHKRKVQVWKKYLEYLEEEYSRTKNDDMLDEIVRTQKEIELLENT